MKGKEFFIKENFMSSIYVHPPRTGGTVLRRVINNIDYGSNNHISFKKLVKRYGRGHFYYSTIRNPLERLLSVFYSFGYKERVLSQVFGKNLSFNEFVLRLDEVVAKGFEPFAVLPQTDMIYDGNDRVDFIIKNENLKEDFVNLLNKIVKNNNYFSKQEIDNIISDKVHNEGIVNHSITNGSAYPEKKDYRLYYSEEALAFAKDFYKKDIENFNYVI